LRATAQRLPVRTALPLLIREVLDEWRRKAQAARHQRQPRPHAQGQQEQRTHDATIPCQMRARGSLTHQTTRGRSGAT
jgi:hypothetical protein